MSLSLDRKYILAISHRFESWIQKSPVLFNCKCPLCGDGSSGKKRRGYFYVRDNRWWYHCHNGCGTKSIKNLLKQMDFGLYQQYNLEQFQTKKDEYESDNIFRSKVGIAFDPDPATKELRRLPKISQLPVGHPARTYLEKRRIPVVMHTILRWSSQFMQFSNLLVPKFTKENLKLDHGRIVIPYFSEDNKFFAMNGRVADDKSSPRYMLIIVNKDIPLLYGMNNVNREKTIYAVEGPIDSFFLDNSIAIGGSSNISVLTTLDKCDIVVILDNEPRKAETVKHINQAIDLGYKVCIWPEWIEQKDINSMVLAGQSPEYIQSIIRKCTYTGLEAKMKLAQWHR